MKNIIHLVQSSVGKKIIMALSGMGFLLFVISHVSANLMIMVSPEWYNAYSHALVTNPFIYVAEAGLVLLFSVHMVMALILTLKAKKASMGKTALSSKGGASRRNLASGSMFYSGIVIFAFVVFHVITIKYGKFYEATLSDGTQVRDIHRLIVEMFQNPIIAIVYVLCMLFVGAHLYHAFASGFQSFGVFHAGWNKLIIGFGKFLAIIVTIGFILMPLWGYFFT